MKVTKFGHCCLLLEINGVVLLTDPGTFTTEQNGVTGIDAVLITHEHADHFHIESVEAIRKNNPDAVIITNSAVGKLLQEKQIPFTLVGDGQHGEVKGVSVEGHGKDHAPIYQSIPQVENTGFYVADTFFFPGDGFYNPKKQVGILALPVAGPWMKVSEAIEYAKAVKAERAFGVHDGILAQNFRGFAGQLLERYVPETAYVSIADGGSHEF